MTTSKQTSRIGRVLCVCVGLLIGYLLGSTGSVPPRAQAEVTEGPRRETFKDGGAMNETVLREISATLKRIETRVDRIERNTSPAPQNAGKK